MTKCSYTGCSGSVVDGFCDECGRGPKVETPVIASNATAAVNATGRVAGITSRVSGARRPTAKAFTGTANTGSHGSNASGRSSRRGSSRGSSSRRRALGGGLVQMPVIPSMDPALKIMSNPRVPDSKCFCPVCPADANGNRKKVNPDKKFCPNCGSSYNFKPTLQAGDVIAGQYEIKGAMAFGGLGWIYLGIDNKLGGRWVVLKGLLNSKDEALLLAAAEERKFLSAVKHGKIVSIYNFVTFKGESYIVMEYVGGKTLKEIRKENGPLPVEQAISYILGILPAFTYLHEQKLVYMDFKPDNVLQEGEDVKLIDMGAVRRIGDPGGDIYTTLGYQPPELDDSDKDASFNIDETTDLYTIARALMVLMLDFPLTGKYKYSVPPPNELMFVVPNKPFDDLGLSMAKYSATMKDGSPIPSWLSFNPDSRTFYGTAPVGIAFIEVTVKAQGPLKNGSIDFTIDLPFVEHESLYRFCLKATDKNPDNRFQNAEEMTGQLMGILREIVVKKGTQIPRFESPEFMPERDPGSEIVDQTVAWKYLPMLKVDQEDEAVSEVFSISNIGILDDRIEAITKLIKAKPKSSEACLRAADYVIEALADYEPKKTVYEETVDTVMKYLDAAMAIDPFDWRPDWYCGKLYLAVGKFIEAVECFDKVYGEMPGELAPKLALAIALEGAKRYQEADIFYDVVSKIDPSFAMAAFGLARCRSGSRFGMIDALQRVPNGSASYSESQLAIVNTLVDSSVAPPSVDELATASDIIKAIHRTDISRYETEARLALELSRQIETGEIKTSFKVGAPIKPILGIGIDPRYPKAKSFREHAEHAYRLCARQVQDRDERIKYVDMANEVRPTTSW